MLNESLDELERKDNYTSGVSIILIFNLQFLMSIKNTCQYSIFYMVVSKFYFLIIFCLNILFKVLMQSLKMTLCFISSNVFTLS